MRSEEEEANATLIEAAPNMLKALEAIIDSGEIPYCDTDPRVVIARAAIAKARGES
jgi:hypothetical protein